MPAPYPPDTLDYWLHLWCETYSWLERSKPEPPLFVCYEDLCTRAETWRRLAELAAISGPYEVGEPFHLSKLGTARFYFARLLPRIHSLSASVKAGSDSLYLLEAGQL